MGFRHGIDRKVFVEFPGSNTAGITPVTPDWLAACNTSVQRGPKGPVARGCCMDLLRVPFLATEVNELK